MRKRIHLFSIILINLIILIVVFAIAIAGNKVITVITENAPLNNRVCVIIDPGHGGVDGGATSCTGVLESQINLEIALRLDDLMHLLGIDTLMIRKTDISVYTEGESIAAKKVSDLKQRVKIVNEIENAILLSIHQNHFDNSRYYGSQVFYAGTTGSEKLAKKLQTAIVGTLNPGSKRQAKKADGVYLMQNIKSPGVLIECGFLSNPEEEVKLRSDAYQKKLCCVIACTITTHLQENTIA